MSDQLPFFFVEGRNQLDQSPQSVLLPFLRLAALKSSARYRSLSSRSVEFITDVVIGVFDVTRLLDSAASRHQSRDYHTSFI